VATKKKKSPARKTKKSKPAQKKKTSTRKKPATPKKKTAKKASKKKTAKKRVPPKKAVQKKKAKVKKAARKTVKKPKTVNRSKAVAKKTAKKITPAARSKAVPKKTKPAIRKSISKKLDPLVVKIKTKLLKERSELLSMIRSSQEVERNVGDITFSNEIDLASSLEGREMAFQLSSRERNELRLIEDSLFKIASGTYGVCEGCSKIIGIKRLQILPLTSLCIQCQENLEVS